MPIEKPLFSVFTYALESSKQFADFAREIDDPVETVKLSPWATKIIHSHFQPIATEWVKEDHPEREIAKKIIGVLGRYSYDLPDLEICERETMTAVFQYLDFYLLSSSYVSDKKDSIKSDYLALVKSLGLEDFLTEEDWLERGFVERVSKTKISELSHFKHARPEANGKERHLFRLAENYRRQLLAEKEEKRNRLSSPLAKEKKS